MMVLVLMQAIAVPIMVGLLGFWVLQRRMIEGAHLKVLAVLALDIALPCHVLVTLLDRFDPYSMPDWWNRPLWWAGSVLFFGLFTIAGRRLFPAAVRREAGATLFYPNAVFLPMVVIMELFGRDSAYLTDLFLFTLLFSMFYFNTIGLFFAGATGRFRVLNPVLAATLCGMLLKILRIDFVAPEFLRSGLRLVGAMAAPALLLLLGGNIFMDLSSPRDLFRRDTLLFVLLKNIVMPLAMLGIVYVLRPAFAPALILMLHAAVPPLTSLPSMTERYGGQRAVVGRYMVAGFACSLITVPVFMIAFFRLYGMAVIE